MSVLVKNMEMPKDCRECRLMEYHSNLGETWCAPAVGLLAVDFKPIPFDGRPDWCPLVELKPHGRLIDADETLKRYCTENCRKKPSCEEDCFIYDLMHLEKPVIEAEGEE